jgi:glycosyltransferase involved in cell wall biosynthesis
MLGLQAEVTSPRIVVAMSVWNEEQYLDETIPAVLAQTMPDFQFVILDNGSTDGSWATLQGFTDPRITLIRSAVNLAPAVVANDVWGLCLDQWRECRWFLPAGADDMMEPDYFEAILAASEANPDVNCIYSPVRFIGHPKRGTWTYPPYAPTRIHEMHQIPGWRAFTRELWDAVGPENETCGIGSDWEWIVRASVKGALRPHQLDRPYLSVRVREHGRVTQSDTGDRPALLRHLAGLAR